MDDTYVWHFVKSLNVLFHRYTVGECADGVGVLVRGWEEAVGDRYSGSVGGVYHGWMGGGGGDEGGVGECGEGYDLEELV